MSYLKYLKYLNKNIQKKSDRVTYNITINYPVNFKHLKYKNKNLLFFGDYHGDYNNMCPENIKYLNLDEFIISLIELGKKINLMIEIPLNKPIGTIDENEKTKISEVAEVFKSCLGSKCHKNFTFTPVDIRYDDIFLLLSIISMLYESEYSAEKKLLTKEKYKNLLILYKKTTNNVIDNGLIVDLINNMTETDEKNKIYEYYENKMKIVNHYLDEDEKIMNKIFSGESKKTLKDLLRVLWAHTMVINGFIMDLYIICSILQSKDDIIVCYCGALHITNICEFFDNYMENNTLTLNNREIEMKEINNEKYPERCLKDLKIFFDFV